MYVPTRSMPSSFEMVRFAYASVQLATVSVATRCGPLREVTRIVIGSKGHRRTGQVSQRINSEREPSSLCSRSLTWNPTRTCGSYTYTEKAVPLSNRDDSLHSRTRVFISHLLSASQSWISDMTRGSSSKGYTVDSTGTNSQVSSKIFLRHNRNLDSQAYVSAWSTIPMNPSFPNHRDPDLSLELYGSQLDSHRGGYFLSQATTRRRMS